MAQSVGEALTESVGEAVVAAHDGAQLDAIWRGVLEIVQASLGLHAVTGASLRGGAVHLEPDPATQHEEHLHRMGMAAVVALSTTPGLELLGAE